MDKDKKKSFNFKWLFILPIGIFFIYLYFYYSFSEIEVRKQFLSLLFIQYITITSIILLIILSILFLYLYIKYKKQLSYLKPKKINNNLLSNHIIETYSSIKKHLKNKYGLFWKYKTKVVIIFGYESNIQLLSENFNKNLWIEGDKTVFLWLKNEQEMFAHEDVIDLYQLRGFPIDGIVWVASSDYLYKPISTQNISSSLCNLYKKLKVRIPFYIWIVQHEFTNQEKCFSQPIYCSLSNLSNLQNILNSVVTPLINSGISPLIENSKNTYLLEFAYALLNGGNKQLATNLKSFIDKKNSITLTGLMFSQPFNKQPSYKKGWFQNTNWQEISKDLRYRSLQRLGLSKKEQLQVGFISLIALWGIGSITSYFINKNSIFNNSKLAYQVINERLPTAHGLLLQKQFQREIERKQFLIQHRAPWYSRFGLNQNTHQVTALWPYYQRANNKLMQAKIVDLLYQKLSFFQENQKTITNISQVKEIYNLLKSYLMMAKPEKMDVGFWEPFIFENWNKRNNVTQGIWENTAPALLTFYAKNFPNHPDWKINVDVNLVENIRKILLHQIGNNKVEENLYNQIIQTASIHFPKIELKNIVNNTDVQQLFLTTKTVPGVFTRNAWEKEIKNTIDQAVQKPRQNVDWVLSDSVEKIVDHEDNKALKELLTQHYFLDFQKNWAVFLNSIQWRQSKSIDDTILQLTLLADIKRSPFIALINRINYEGKTGKQADDIPGSLVQSTRKLFWNNKDDAINQKETISYPMDDTFGLLLTIIEGKAGGDGITNINIQSFLTKVTLLRLKLQQISKISDPRAVNQIVFQDKDTQLADAHQYAQLMAAFVGDSLGQFGNTLFVKPIEQVKKSVTQPASKNMNNSWQKNIAGEWNKAFTNKYPFSPKSKNDVSFDLLGQYLRPDTGRLDKFIQSQLGHLMHKEGNMWVIDPLAADGLNFDPQFIKAINQLNQLSEALFITPNAHFHFELQARPSLFFTRSEFIIDDQKIIYFNQADDWEAIDWPENSDLQGASLSVVDYSTKLQTLAEYDDKLGIIRLFDKAKIKQIDSNIFQLTWKLPRSKKTITYVLRNDTGKGILTLLDLKNFHFPQQIFEEQ